ncbi:MAG TPA: hypothetical protein VG102_01680, partial [Candidatus Paceibacterota bacterium]|nr:hypothetical protein [Candidatus Paceibacterota bacterium]
RQTGRPFLKRTTILGKEIPFEGSPVFEVNRFILDREGGHVTFERREGTFYALGGGAIEDVEFPYPHPMFEVIDEAEAA